jgi:hypothetical protein
MSGSELSVRKLRHDIIATVAHMLRHAKYINHQRVYELDVRRPSVFSQSTTTESEIILLYHYQSADATRTYRNISGI